MTVDHHRLRTDGGTVGPVILSHPVARGQLLREGEVMTVRDADRTTGETWWTTGRGEQKSGDVTIEVVVEEPDALDLMGHVELSGFADLDAWQAAIRELHGGVAPEDIGLYRVRAVEGECAACGQERRLVYEGHCPECSQEAGLVDVDARERPEPEVKNG